MINKYEEKNKLYSYTKFAQREGIDQDKKIGYFLPKPHEIGDVWDAMEYFALNYSNDIEFSIMFKYFDRIMDFYEHYDYVAYVDYDNKNPKNLDFLTAEHIRQKDGLFAARIGYYKTLQDFKDYKLDTIYSDRLFFDFDVEDERIKPLKEELVELEDDWKLALKYRIPVWEKYQQLILEENLLETPFNEAKKLCDFLQKQGLKPYLVFSGSKGFHCNLFFPEQQLTQVKAISESLSQSWSKQLQLSCLDSAVYIKRTPLQRIPYTVNEKTGLNCLPLDVNITYDKVLDLISKNDATPHDFSINDYYPPEGFTKMLLRLNKKFTEKEEERKRKQKLIKFKVSKNQKYSKNILGNVDMKELVRAIASEREDPPYSNQYHCLFHHPDIHQSGVAFDDNYYCSTCGRIWNPYDLIKDYYGCKTKQQVINKFKELLKKDSK